MMSVQLLEETQMEKEQRQSKKMDNACKKLQEAQREFHDLIGLVVDKLNDDKSLKYKIRLYEVDITGRGIEITILQFSSTKSGETGRPMAGDDNERVKKRLKGIFKTSSFSTHVVFSPTAFR